LRCESLCPYISRTLRDIRDSPPDTEHTKTAQKSSNIVLPRKDSRDTTRPAVSESEKLGVVAPTASCSKRLISVTTYDARCASIVLAGIFSNISFNLGKLY